MALRNLGGRSFVLWTWLLAAWFALGPVALSVAADTDSLDVFQALEEMKRLEVELENHQRRRGEDERELFEINQSLQTVRDSLAGRRELEEESRRTFESIEEQAHLERERIRRSLDHEKRALEATRGRLRRIAAVLYHQTEDPTPAPRALLTLALLQKHHRDQAAIGTGRILRLEQEDGEIENNRRLTRETARYHSVFTGYGIRQLQEQHAATARRVAALQRDLERRSEAEAGLSTRRDELKELIARLAQSETERVAREAAVGDTEAARDTAEAAPDPDSDPARADVGSAQPDLAETPYEEGSDPLVSRTGGEGPDDLQSSADGTRYLFWRALPVDVRALASGRVMFAGPFAGNRHLLIIDHGGGWRTLHGNLAQCELKTGDPVQVRQVIGRYRAGQATRAEPLWFEVRRGAQPAPPETWPSLPSQWERKLFKRVPNGDDQGMLAPAE